MRIRSITAIGAALALGCASLSAFAGETQRVTCEKRANRSKVSVDGKALAAGNYFARIDAMDGVNVAQSNPAPAVAGEAEFDFDSNANDVAEGATPIAAGFITGKQITGSLFDASTNRLIWSKTVDCRIRSR